LDNDPDPPERAISAIDLSLKKTLLTLSSPSSATFR